MIQKDIRNAGFRFESSAAITDPIKVYDAGDCCDRIEIIYDETETPLKRIKIEYRLQQYSSDNSRFRLYKKKTNMTNNTVEFDSPIADYVEVLQFTGTNSGCPTDGSYQSGCGTEKWVKPEYYNLPNNWVYDYCYDCRETICGIGPAVDGDVTTATDCRFNSGRWDGAMFPFQFSNPSIIKRVKMGTTGTFPFRNRNDASRYGGDYSGTLHVGLTNCGHLNINSWSNSLRYDIHPYASHDRSYTFQFPIATADPNAEGFRQGSIGYTGTGNRITGSPTYPMANGCVHGDYPYEVSTGGLGDHVSQYWYMLTEEFRYITYTGDYASSTNNRSMHAEISEIEFLVEEFSSSAPTLEVATDLLLRSPNEHGNVDRGFNKTIGNYSVSKNDKYLRDSYSTSSTIRNTFYN